MSARHAGCWPDRPEAHGMPGCSLRTKLIIACVVVEVAATAMALMGSAHLIQTTLKEQATVQAQEVLALLDQALATPLAQRDYATVQQTLDLVRSPQAINYLALFDHRNQLVAISGWDAVRPLPPRDAGDIDLDRADTTLHLAAPIVVAGQQIARLDLGMSTDRLRRARDELRYRSLLISAFALALSIALMAAIAFAITRHLAKLVQASQRVAAGDFDIQIPVQANDEIGQLGASFNAMAATIKQRVAALQESEQQQRRNLKTARDEQARLSTLLGALRSGILFVDANNQVIYANASFAQIWSLTGLMPGRPMSEVIPLLAQRTTPEGAPHLKAMLEAGASHPALLNHDLHTIDGRVISQRMQIVAEGPDGGGGCIWLHQDITKDRQMQNQARQAVRDQLTDLLNRRGLFESLQAALDHAARTSTSVTLMFIDLDDFKRANDAAGHRVGDDILVAVARTLSDQLHQGEIVARLGGDEFAVLIPGISVDAAGATAQRLVQAVSALRFEAADWTLRVGCSIGLASFPADAQTADDLVACADTAMYQAKQGGKNGWFLHRSDSVSLQVT
jgi:diguanylate cyclase (GGDEF)-like protein